MGGDGPRRLGREEGSLLGKRTTLKGLGKNNRIIFYTCVHFGGD